ncbi:hypothetical protein JKL49_11385 [Phenylobacterium sp. 20VBR1]|uniref:Uncharacterized protein n=1 Tax=Phenylobacterium glaciei TaxID=2803784 RepID=A0A941D322_9CAUL|nr:hypothetical protein [Phenylobacterium glaciei]MBR7619991.1 hypothetical protein [Phenylobacterium glaciei]
MSEEVVAAPARRRTIKRAAKAPVSVENAPEVDLPTQVTAPETSGAPPVTTMFVACLAFGTALCLLGAIDSPIAKFAGVFGPIGATLIYPIWGASRRLHRRASLRERFADNCYYLGFIFTQLALVVGFLPVALFNRTMGSNDVLRFFSLALGASLVGLVARTFFVQVGQSVTESSDLVEGEVDALARMVSAKSRKVLGEFEALSAKLGESYLKLGTNLEASAETLQRTMQRFDQAVRSDIDILEREGGSAGAATAVAATEIVAQQEHFSSKIEAAARAIDALKDGLLAQSSEAGRAITQASESLSKGLNALQDVSGLADGVRAIDERLGAITQQMSSVGTGIEEATQSVRASAEAAASATATASAEAVRSTEVAVERLKSQALTKAEALDGDLQATVAALENTLSAFRAELERIRV